MEFLDLIGYRKPTPRSSPVDVRTNPGTYQNISRGVDQTLQRRLPTSFQGAGIQNAPMNVLGQVSDISRMPPGPAREAARNQLQRNLQMADRLNNAGTPRPFGQGAGGGLRAPGIGPGGSNAPGMTFNPNTRLPGGGPFQQDYGMTRDAMRAVKGAGSVAQGLKGLAQGGATAGLGYALDVAAPTLAEEAIRGLSTVTGGVSTPTWLKSVNGTNYDIRTSEGMEAYKKAMRGQRNTPTEPAGYLDVGVDPTTGQPTLVSKAGPPLPTAASEQETGAWTVNGWDPTAKRPTLTTENGALTDKRQVTPAAINPSTQLPASAEQTMIDPTAYALQVYGQGTQAAKNKTQQDAVRDLGLAIHRQKFPHLYDNSTSMSPGMRRTFPDFSPGSLDNFLQEKGVQQPMSMIEASSIPAILDNQSAQYQQTFAFNNPTPADMAFDPAVNPVMEEGMAAYDVKREIAAVEEMLKGLKKK